MALAGLVAVIEDAVENDLDTLTTDELSCLTIASEQLRSRLEGLFSTVLAAADDRRAFTATGHRSAATWLAYETSTHRDSCGRRIKQAGRLHNTLPLVAAAVVAGDMTFDHAQRIVALAANRDLREAVIRDQRLFIGWATTETWPSFRRFIDSWEILNDPTDPQDADEKAFLDRRMIWGQGVGNTALVELNIPNELFEALLNQMQPIYDSMRAEDWRAAQVEFGDNAEFTDLARSDRQRWLDALLQLARQGAASGLDGGVQTVVNILMDQGTFDRELNRRAGVETQDDLVAHDYESWQCETLSGLPLSPRSAFDAAVRGHIRRVVFSSTNLDFSMSRKARLFTGSKRLGMIMRDRHCRGPGCDTPAHRCEGDHEQEFSRGGDTIPINGVMRCGPCHRWKTRMQALGTWENITKLQNTPAQANAA